MAGDFVVDVRGGTRRVAVAVVCSLVLITCQYAVGHFLTPTPAENLTDYPYDEPRRLYYSSRRRYGTSYSKPHNGYGSGSHSYTKSKSAKETFVNMVVGPILCWMSFTILFVNEGRHVKMQALIDLVKKSVKTITPDDRGSAADGDVVHVQGLITSPSNALQDDLYPEISAPPDGVKLRRQVEMYLWTEEKKDREGETEYIYERKWVKSYVDSSTFDDRSKTNPPPPKTASGLPLFREYTEGLESGKRVAYGRDVMLGGFVAGPRVLGKLHNWHPIEIDNQVMKSMRLEDYLDPAATMVDGKPGIAWKKRDQANDVGDVRMTYDYTKPCDISVTAVIIGDEFQTMQYDDLTMAQKVCGDFQAGKFHKVSTHEPDAEHLAGADDFEDEPGIYDDIMRGIGFMASSLSVENLSRYNCCICCWLGLSFFDAAAPAELLIVSRGRLSLEENLVEAGGESSQMLYFMRIFGFLLMWTGLHLFFDPLITILSYIPLLGYVLISMISCATCLCACGCSISTITVAWVFYRPLRGLLILTLTLAFWFGMGYVADKQQPAVTPTPDAAAIPGLSSTAAPSIPHVVAPANGTAMAGTVDLGNENYAVPGLSSTAPSGIPKAAPAQGFLSTAIPGSAMAGTADSASVTNAAPGLSSTAPPAIEDVAPAQSTGIPGTSMSVATDS